MKKILFFIFSITMLPIYAFAYSDFIIPGGDTIGITIQSDGILVTGFYKIKGKYNKSPLKAGDYILEVEDNLVYSLDELTNLIEKYKNQDKIKIKYRRNEKTYEGDIKLQYEDNVYKTGLYVKDSITGCGTLTYIDPQTKIYGALGHEIIESSTNEIIEIKQGDIFENKITSITKSYDGHPGSKNSVFNVNKIYGDIRKNTKVGIYGKYTDELPDKTLLKVSSPEDVKIGNASIMTVIDGQDIKSYDVEITNINEESKTKNITFKIVDKELLSKTGGVIQGMSGSPIIQNDNIIGAVTHVKVDDVTGGYGVFITTMLEEGEN